MRQGSKRKEWSVAEIRWLLDNAGSIPKREICRRLKRSSSSVKHMAHRLNKQGYSVSLRCYEPKATICPSCGRMSLTTRNSGICEPCSLQRQLTSIESQISDLLAQLPPDIRAIYEETEAEKSTRVIDPMPKRPVYRETPTRYQRLKDEEAYDAEVEAWVAKRYHRKVKAAQKRKERIMHKLKTL